MIEHWKDTVIALTAIMAANGLNGPVDLRQAYGSKTIHFQASTNERNPGRRSGYYFSA